MTVDEWVQVVLAVGTICVALVAWLAIRREMRSEGKTGGENRMKELARVEQEPLKDRVSANDARITQLRDTLNRVENTLVNVDNNVHDTRERLSSVESLQRQHIEQITMSLMKLIHQPDPARAHIDHLLEAYMEGVATETDVIDLKKLLIKIRNFESVTDQVEESRRQLGFPVFPGEQTAAAILLGTMDLIDPARLSSYGHAKHRAEGHAKNQEKDGSDDPDAE